MDKGFYLWCNLGSPSYYSYGATFDFSSKVNALRKEKFRLANCRYVQSALLQEARATQHWSVSVLGLETFRVGRCRGIAQ
jgi:hypothetical protein